MVPSYSPPGGLLAIQLDRWMLPIAFGQGPWLLAHKQCSFGLAKERKPGVAVDVASGTGRHAAYLLARGHRVIAVDSSEAMIAKARERLPHADLRVGDLYELPVADATADLGVCSLALTHVPELVRPINELSRIVKKDGHVIVSDVHPLAVATSAHAFFKTLEGSRAVIKNHVHWVSEYISAFIEAKLDIVECVEPKIDAASIETINPPPTVRHWVEEALLGLPFALVWDLEKAH